MTQAVSVQPDVVLAPPPEDDRLYEVVNGQRVEMPPMSAYEVGVISNLVTQLQVFARQQQVGRAVAEMLFALTPPGGLQRRPDVAFVSFQTWPRDQRIPRTNAWAVVPDLAVEVVSPTNFAEEVVTRVLEYFQAGTRQVWVVYPGPQQVYVYRSPTEIRVFTRPEQIEGEPVLPGLRLPVATLFEEEVAGA
jgi:Uma2 family endonuclease